MLGCLSMGLLAPMRNEQTSSLCQLMKQLDVSSDYLLLIHQLLRGAFALLLRATNIRTGCRLALLNGDTTKALVFEPDRRQLGSLEAELGNAMVRPAPAPAPGGAAGAAGGAAGAQEPQIHVTEIPLDNTLLLDAVQKGKARFVSDCASYIQSCMKPATDIFISGQEMVASIVVLPLIYEGATFGGFYGARGAPPACVQTDQLEGGVREVDRTLRSSCFCFCAVTLETTSNFQKIKDLLMGFVNSVVLVLHKRLQPQRDTIWASIVNVRGCCLASPPPPSSLVRRAQQHPCAHLTLRLLTLALRPQKNEAEAGADSAAAAAAGGAGGNLASPARLQAGALAGGGGAGGVANSGAHSSVLDTGPGTASLGAKPVLMKRSCTEAMLKVRGRLEGRASGRGHGLLLFSHARRARVLRFCRFGVLVSCSATQRAVRAVRAARAAGAAARDPQDARQVAGARVDRGAGAAGDCGQGRLWRGACVRAGEGEGEGVGRAGSCVSDGQGKGLLACRLPAAFGSWRRRCRTL